MWGGTENPRGKTLEEYFLMNEITCMNVGSSPTFQQGIKSSIIDLTLINKHANWIAVQDWKVEGGSLSDHKIISYRINDYEPYKQSFRNYKKVEWERYKYLQQQLTELMHTVEQEQKERVQVTRPQRTAPMEPRGTKRKAILTPWGRINVKAETRSMTSRRTPINKRVTNKHKKNASSFRALAKMGTVTQVSGPNTQYRRA
jgi:hypothetical protein